MTPKLMCNRCGELKEAGRFRPDQPSHHRWCLRCERTPSGELPYKQTDDDWVDSQPKLTASSQG